MTDKHTLSENEPLSANDAWTDYMSLRDALVADSGASETLPASPQTLALVKELVEAGVCRDEAEVVNRAVRTFYVAVFPHDAERQRVLREAASPYRPRGKSQGHD
jgi:hypothetical protein